MKRILAAMAFLALLAVGSAASACGIPQPKGEVILTVNGMINRCNVGLEVQFDRGLFDSLPRHTVKTANPWEHGLVTYEGVLLRDLMEFVGADGTSATITALNDYRSNISLADLQDYDVILADRRNGEIIPVRDKGPFFVVFPFTDVPALSTEDRFAQSVWQVDQITVK